MHHSVPFTTLTDAKNLETLLGREPSSHAPICRAETPNSCLELDVGMYILSERVTENHAQDRAPETDRSRRSNTDRQRRRHRKGEEEKPREKIRVCVRRCGGWVRGRPNKFQNTDREKGDTTHRPLMAPAMNGATNLPTVCLRPCEWEHDVGAAFCRPYSQTLLGSTAC